MKVEAKLEVVAAPLKVTLMLTASEAQILRDIMGATTYDTARLWIEALSDFLGDECEGVTFLRDFQHAMYARITEALDNDA